MKSQPSPHRRYVKAIERVLLHSPFEKFEILSIRPVHPLGLLTCSPPCEQHSRRLLVRRHKNPTTSLS